ncbi:MAG: FHA domain-containing protein [Oscillospiraceae bacterium]|nr:FHA domain-containing protein [Oscillospiraceae bacterium]
MTDMQNSTQYSEPYIRLKNADDEAQAWEASLWSAVVIGRADECRIQIIEKSVSREQCRIFINGSVFIENISQTNVTKLNGKELYAIAPLNIGDKINCGRIELLVDELNIPTHDQMKAFAEGTMFINI